MSFSPGLEKVLGKRTLIIGEMGSGKTRLLGQLLDQLIEMGLGEEVTLIEMAPGLITAGRLLEDYTKNVFKVRYLKPWIIIPPRLMGKNPEEVIRYARFNHLALKPLIEEYLEKPSRILLINDLTIYLHDGDLNDIEKVIKAAETFIATAYEGERLSDDKGSGITERERRSLNALKKIVDQVIKL